MVINMRKNELIKTKLYFVLAALLLTAVCIIVYTSMRNSEKPNDRPYELAQEQGSAAEGAATDLQQVNSTPYPDSSTQRPAPSQGKDLAAQDPSVGMTYSLAVTDGYLEVYDAQTGMLYMETAIAYDLLPERVQKQIDEGKYFETEEALLEFLENYSS